MTVHNDLLKPTRFEADPNADNAGKKFKHWLRLFTAFIDDCVATATAREVAAPNKLNVLFAYVSAEVFEYIEDCTGYDEAVAKLKTVYIKQPNIIFARHLLATRKQKPEESLQDFLQKLHALSKDCGFTNVTAELYKGEMVRDSFINGLISYSIRHRLLENNQLTLDRAFQIADSINNALEHSTAYGEGNFTASMKHPK